MSVEILCISLFFACLSFQTWAFKTLPSEKWQIIAVIPKRKTGVNLWSAVNLTFYGFFIALAYTSSLVVFVLLMGSISISLWISLFIAILIGIICVPASKIVAVLVEKSRHTFTVGGASFVGVIFSPWILRILSLWEFKMKFIDEGMIMPILSCLVISYALGEGLGRLGCISFGCCYGKPVRSCGRIMRNIFSKHAFIFQGRTKKAVYAGGYENERLVPIQAITSIIFVFTAIWGIYLFLKGYYNASFIMTITITQLWRLFSEFLRDDYRGGGKVTAYQLMSIFALLYIILISLFMPPAISMLPELTKGFHNLWNPVAIIFLNLLWFILFFIFGKSTVTASSVDLYVIKEDV